MAKTFDLKDDSVVVVVGSGPGGGILANELAQKGVDVVCLEAGPRLTLSDIVNDGDTMFGRLSWLDKRIGTGELNRFIQLVEFDKDLKVHYMTQASVRPPTFIAFTDKGKELHFSTERYLINQLRKRFGFAGTPIEIKVKRR